MDRKIDWMIHCCANGYCETCGKFEVSFFSYICNAHTHGMQKYGHMDFQMVLRLPDREIARILNTFGRWVQAGRRFHDGDMVSGIYTDCEVRLDMFEETGRRVLRVVIPDRNNCFPESPDCMEPYRFQKLPTNKLYILEDKDHEN